MNTSVSKPERFLLLDVMRAAAVLLMIQGHAADALLSHAYLNTESVSWKIWEFIRGLTAPVFLFGSGFAYVLATVAKAGGGPMPLPLFWRRFRWILVLFATGALMHVPVPTFERILQMTPVQWSGFYQVDILRLMAVTLLMLLAIFLFTRSPRGIFRATLGMTAGIVLVTPLVYDVPWLKILPESFAAYFSNQTGSFFPVFPFSAYLFAGAACGALYLRWKSAGMETLLMRRFALLGAAFVAAGLLLDFLPINVYPTYNYWKTSPNLFLFRTGCVLGLWSLIGAALRRIRSVPRFIPQVGQHTLAIYAGHIIGLYGCAWFNGISFYTGKTLGFAPVIGIILGMYLSAVLLAVGLDHLKQRRRWMYRGLQLALPATIFILTLR